MPTLPDQFEVLKEKNVLERFGLTHLLPGFLARRAQEVIEMQALLEKSDFETLRRLAHSLKGSGANFGFDNLTDLGDRLELAAVAENSALCGTLINEYAEILKTIAPSST